MANAFDRAGFVSVLGGMNGALTPSLLSDTQYAFGLNVSSRGGLLHTRPRWYRMWHYIPSGKFQGAFVYRSRYRKYLACVVDGVLYLIDIDAGTRWRCTAFPNRTFDRAYFCQVDRFLVVQNGIISPTENWPIIMDDWCVVDNGAVQVLTTEADTTAWQAEDPHAEGDVGADAAWARLRDLVNYEAKRVPIGTHMAYGHGRLFVCVSRLWDNGIETGNEGWITVGPSAYFVAGDIIKADNADEVLAFTETDYLSGGGGLSLPTEGGKIVGFQFFRNAATGTGVGELVVFGERCVSAFAVGMARSQWNDVNMAQVLFTGSGATSERAILPVNDDIAYRAEDGLRFVKYTAYQTGGSSGSLSNLPQSMEVSSLLRGDVPYYNERASMSLSDDRLLLAALGTRELSDDEYVNFFQGVISLDTYVVGATGSSGNLMSRSNPAYDGVWTGPLIQQTLTLPTSVGQFPAVVAHVLGRNEVWVLTDAYAVDGEADKPLCRIITKSFDFGKPLDPKEFKYAEMWVSDVFGAVDFKLYWRPDDYSKWTATNAITVTGGQYVGEAATQRWCLRFAVPPDARCYDAATNRDTRRGFAFEYCLEWRGTASIEKIVFYSNPQPSSPPNLGCAPDVIALCAEGSVGEELDMYEYELTPLTALVDPGQIQAPMRPEGEDLIFWNGDDYYYYQDPVDGTSILVEPGTGATVVPTPAAEDEPPPLGRGSTLYGDIDSNNTAPGIPPIPPVAPTEPAAPDPDAPVPTAAWTWYQQNVPVVNPEEKKVEPTTPLAQESQPAKRGCLRLQAPTASANLVQAEDGTYAASLQVCVNEPDGVSGAYYKISMEVLPQETGAVSSGWGTGVMGPYVHGASNCQAVSYAGLANLTADVPVKLTVKSYMDAAATGEPYCTKDVTVTFKPASALPVITLAGAPSLVSVEGSTTPVSDTFTVENTGADDSLLTYASEFKDAGGTELASVALGGLSSGALVKGAGANVASLTFDPTGIDVGEYSGTVTTRETLLSGVESKALPVTVLVVPKYLGALSGTYQVAWNSANPPVAITWSTGTEVTYLSRPAVRRSATWTGGGVNYTLTLHVFTDGLTPVAAGTAQNNRGMGATYTSNYASGTYSADGRFVGSVGDSTAAGFDRPWEFTSS